ncbi:MAG TPA: hypothetical protein PLK27_06220, partial [Neisseria sp.]|nr:hypothetical protein [Neisseria sp.]
YMHCFRFDSKNPLQNTLSVAPAQAGARPARVRQISDFAKISAIKTMRNLNTDAKAAPVQTQQA